MLVVENECSADRIGGRLIIEPNSPSPLILHKNIKEIVSKTLTYSNFVLANKYVVVVEGIDMGGVDNVRFADAHKH